MATLDGAEYEATYAYDGGTKTVKGTTDSARAVRLAPPVDAPVVLQPVPHTGNRGVDVQEVRRQGAPSPL